MSDVDALRVLVAAAAFALVLWLLWRGFGRDLSTAGRWMLIGVVVVAGIGGLAGFVTGAPLPIVAGFLPLLAFSWVAGGRGPLARVAIRAERGLLRDWSRLQRLVEAGAPGIPERDRIQRAIEALETWRRPETSAFVDTAKEVVERWLWSAPTSAAEERELDERLRQAGDRLWGTGVDAREG